MKSTVRVVSAVFLCCAFALPSCGDDEEPKKDNGDDGRPDDTGAACEVPGDCFPEVADGELQGEAVCIDRVRDGYCTHTCEADDDCCAADGECDDSVTAVCSPFESMTGMHCFLSCEDSDTGAGGAGGMVVDEQEFCQRNAGTDFICRSSGGGTDNRRICVPADCGAGADCTDDADCDTGLECLTTVDGGYCTARGCTVNTDCPGMNDRCVTVGDENFCYRSCTQESDCTLCRHDTDSTCSADVTFADGTSTGSVCVPG